MEDWIEANIDRLYGYAHSLAGDREEARDLVHDAIVRAMEAKRIPASRDGYRPWMFRILRNAFVDRCRRAGVVVFSGIADDPPADASAGWSGDRRLVEIVTVRIAMEKLTLHHREIIVLIDFVGCSYAEAAEILDIPEGTVMSRVSRARKALLDLVDDGKVTPLIRGARSGGAVS